MLEEWLTVILAMAASFALGSIPTGYWVGKLRGVDIRTRGSGNVGATNVQRQLGTVAGVLVLLIDTGKGFMAVLLLPQLTLHPAADWIRVVCALSAVGGHVFSPFLRFKGGKGVATTFGVFLALAPMATALVALIFLALVAATRYVSLGSVVAALLLPLLIWVDGESGQNFSILLLSLLAAALILVRHRTNLGRLLRGEENRFGKSKSTGSEQAP